MSELPSVEIGVFGGSGFYELLDNPKRVSGQHAVRRTVVAGHGGRDRRAHAWPSCRGTARSTRCRRT